MNMAIEGLRKYQRRNRNGLFDSLPPELRPIAREWLERFLTRRRARGLPITRWRYANYCGLAAQLARHPRGSDWGRSMHGKRGGYGVQRKYARGGRNPTKKANFVRLCRQGHPDSARKFLESQREANPARVEVSGNEPRTWQVLGRPGAPPMTVTVGRRPDRLLPLHSLGCPCDLCARPFEP